jgi:NADH dehydrogenase
VELAGALGEIARNTLRRDFRNIDTELAHITLLEGAPRILPTFPEDLSAKARAALERLCVRVVAGAKVTRISEREVRVAVGDRTETLEAGTIIWAAGVTASPLGRKLAEKAGAPVDRAGRVIVEPDLTLPGHSEILVLGDLAAYLHQGGKPLPGVAPAAMQQGRYAARALRMRLAGRKPPPFRYRDKGSLATIGRNAAVAQLGRFRFGGHFAWVLWLLVHIAYLIGFENRVLVLIQWAWNYFTWNRGARLITQSEARDP